MTLPPPVSSPLPPPPPAAHSLERARSPVISYTILGVTVGIYLLQMLSEVLLQNDWPALLGMKINEYIVAGQLWRLVTPVLLHGSIMHIGFNMYALLSMGTAVERESGRRRFILLYLLSAFAGNVMSFLLSPNPSLGASTAIFGLLGAQGVFVFQNRRFIRNSGAILQNIVIIAAVNLVIGLSPGIDNWGHLGGLLGGGLFAWIAGPRYAPSPIYAYAIEEETTPAGALLGAVLVLVIFGTLAAWGILFLY